MSVLHNSVLSGCIDPKREMSVLAPSMVLTTPQGRAMCMSVDASDQTPLHYAIAVGLVTGKYHTAFLILACSEGWRSRVSRDYRGDTPYDLYRRGVTKVWQRNVALGNFLKL